MHAPTLENERVRKVELTGQMNTPDEVILEQVAENIRRGLPQAQPHQPNPHIGLLVCGGPSLATTEKELRDAYWKGGKIIAVNGAYQWCIDRNLKPSAAIMLDAREFNARFVETPVEGCKYLLASQCHPKTFETCRGRETIIWHACSAGDKELTLLNEYYFNRTHPVDMGTTVGVRAISLLRMIGFGHQDIFGLDSCWLDDAHHAYEQPENSERKIPIWLRPKGKNDEARDDKAKRFLCAPWHLKQAEDFMALIRARGDFFELNIRGPGLIAEIMRTGAEIQMEEGK